jgi:maltose O-acetyltransferase
VAEVVFQFLANVLMGSAVIPRPLRWRGLRAVGMDVAASTIAPGVFFGGPNVVVGAGVQISTGTFFDGAETVVLEPGSGVGPRSMLITGRHEQGDATCRVGKLAPRPIVIGAGAWLGAGVIVLPGVHVGAGCIVGAGAVVSRDCEPNGLYVGSPAVRVRDLDPGRPVPRERDPVGR